MVFKTDYWAVVDALKTKLGELVTSGTLKEIILGEESAGAGEEHVRAGYPVAFILPMPYTVKADIPGLEEHPITVDVLIVHQDYDFQAGLKTAVNAAADCRDKLYADKTLGKACNDLFVESFGPSYEKQKDNKAFLFRSRMKTVCVKLFFEA